MEKRKLGFSDLQLGVLGLGCWQFGGGAYWGPQNQQDVDEVVHRAIDSGINYFDTAEVYNGGESERSLGFALKDKRKQVIIGSKISPANFYPSMLAEHCNQSLQRLQTDYIDIYMLHWPLSSHAVAHFTKDESRIAQPPDLQAGFQALLELQKQGKIRYIGISNHGIKQMLEVKENEVPFVCNEMAYNLFSRAIEESILPYCVEHQIGVISYMPLQQGLLSGKYHSLSEIKPMQARSRHFHHSRGEGTRHGEAGAELEIQQAIQDIHGISNEIGISFIVLALAWAIANKGITTSIVGSRNTDQLDLNIQGAYYVIPPDVLAKLNQVTEPVLKKLGSNPDYYENRGNSRIQ